MYETNFKYLFIFLFFIYTSNNNETYGALYTYKSSNNFAYKKNNIQIEEIKDIKR